ncbi:hypothetical protein CcaverHIS002_0604670 [Cutaneotrichosporon cavernicola]|uniref:DUF221-domain-containing protein n=1 Tax=Cutaneotrichosporon cavernicola TaxID=279322 RepID=A0AA48L8N1_9TREE|nr:uncharacterized protein CcaverHIS019_0604110 [Cutaneotrichosporon cavernicola]BEI86180.1 hypothetical protein CcaverHIS002_0604670 [Cutaneotrichosporon cavernicola]BEI93952.1 hypothetical protein CcaverHIS019_0604110 [Cutaneotrichosporon cavernicola]BEJ01733.1 hypothetical protein CcaverHIS631_0604150 [Cutaneotrichosporon cavernicola]
MFTEGRGDEKAGDYSGPWLQTQLMLSLGVGLTSFLVFSFLRTRWQLVYMPRTKLQDFSPAAAHVPDVQQRGWRRLFGWIIPTLRTSDYVVLQTVGLDASVLLSFFFMCFCLFGLFSLLSFFEVVATLILEPDGVEDPVDAMGFSNAWPVLNGTNMKRSFEEILKDPRPPTTVYITFVYIFTGLTLWFLHRNYHYFVNARQAFNLGLIHSVSSRTVIVTQVPHYLRGDRQLAEFFEGCGWRVESVSIGRHVHPIRVALDMRTCALRNLERAWVDWLGNPAKAEGYTPDIYSKAMRNVNGGAPRQRSPEDETDTTPLVQSTGDVSTTYGSTELDPEVLRREFSDIHTAKPRPKLRPHWFGAKVDAISYWEKKFEAADEEVRHLRKTGEFPATHVAFVTFDDVKDTQCAAQVVTYREHSQIVTNLAPEPRDIIWKHVNMTRRSASIRDIVIMGIMTMVLLFLTLPTNAAFASLLSDKLIKKRAPWLWNLMNNDERLKAFIQTTLPSILVATFNSLIPFLLEWLSYMQGFRSRSAVEFSLLRKYYLFLVLSVLLIFLVASTWLKWFELDLGNNPSEIPRKLAESLRSSNARNFMVSYVCLQGMAMMPLQFLNLGPLCSLVFSRMFARTPRDFAEANAPPEINYGWVMSPPLLIFTIAMVYSVESPLVVMFAAVYFGMAYFVYKYKLLFVYFKPFEAGGTAWGITFRRMIWGLLLFQVFVTGLFSLRKKPTAVLFMVALLVYTSWWGYVMNRDFTPLSDYTALSNICEVQNGEGAGDVAGIPEAPRSQQHLNLRRYAVNDDTLYVAPADSRTDYSQPPMNMFYDGVLNTGRRRYASPALNGRLPRPWLPTPARHREFGDGVAERRGVVLSLRRKVAKGFKRNKNSYTDAPADSPVRVMDEPPRVLEGESSTSWNVNPWRDPSPATGSPTIPTPSRSPGRMSFDWSSGVMAFPDEHVWDDDGDDGDDSAPEPDDPASPSTYFHRPERRTTISGLSLDAPAQQHREGRQ